MTTLTTLRAALEENNSLLVAMLHEPRPAAEIMDQINDNRTLIAAMEKSEPVAWVGEVAEGSQLLLKNPQRWEAVPLYTHAQPVEQPLTADAALNLCRDWFLDEIGFTHDHPIVRAIEQAIRSKQA